MSRSTGAEIVCELFKLLRGSWLNKAEIERETDFAEMTVAAWCDALEAHGMLVTRMSQPSERKGCKATKLYTLSATWGGMG